MGNYSDPNIPDLKIPVQGKIVRIFDTKVSNSGFKTRKFWLEHESSPNEQGNSWKDTIEFELSSKADAKFDNTTSLDSIGVGTVVKFVFSLGGSVWNGNPSSPNYKGPICFNKLKPISRFEVVGQVANPSPSSRPHNCPPPAVPPASQTVSYADVDNEMPF